MSHKRLLLNLVWTEHVGRRVGAVKTARASLGGHISLLLVTWVWMKLSHAFTITLSSGWVIGEYILNVLYRRDRKACENKKIFDLNKLNIFSTLNRKVTNHRIIFQQD